MGKLRKGWTTGTCAQAAAKAAAEILLLQEKCSCQRSVTVHLPDGRPAVFPVEDIRYSPAERTACCGVRKDSGDDPDITDKIRVYCTVTLLREERVLIDGGRGIGRVTKPGLDQPVGEAAINRVPRQMICRELEEVKERTGYEGGFSVLVEIPGGEKLAEKTFNPRLGILGGLSVLGTTGVVEPMSEKALLDTIEVEMKVKLAEGRKILVAVPGNYGLDFLKETWGILPEDTVTCSNYIGETLDFALDYGAGGLLFVGHIGKLVKLAGGIMNTHSYQGDCRMELLAAAALRSGLSGEKALQLLSCGTTEEALAHLTESERERVLQKILVKIQEHLTYRCGRHAGHKMQTGAVLFSSVYGMLGMTEGSRQILEQYQRQQTESGRK